MRLIKSSLQPAAEQWVPGKELADLLGVTPARISQIAKGLDFERPATGGYPLRLFVRTYFTRLRKRMEAAEARDTSARQTLKNRLLAVQVQNTELDFRERVEAVTLAADVEASVLAEHERVRDTLMQIGARVASEIAAEGDPHAVRMRLEQEVTAVLEDLSRDDEQEHTP